MSDLLDPLGDAGSPDELLGEAGWIRAMVDVEQALILALVAEGLAPRAVGDMANSLTSTRVDPGLLAASARAGGNPVIPLVTTLQASAEAALPGSSAYLHLGATSQDILDTAAMVVASRVISQAAADLASTAATLAGIATTHRRTPAVGRTLGQQATPLSFGSIVAGWLNSLLSARAQLLHVAAHLPLQYGGAVGSREILHSTIRRGSPEADPSATVVSTLENMARRLGLVNAPPWHSNRLPVVELGAALAGTIGAIGAMANDLTVLSRSEIGEVTERLADGDGGSSAMPHKRNPVTTVLLVAAARRSPALVATLFQAQITDGQRSTGAWHAEWLALRELERLTLQTAATAAELAGRLQVDADRMRSNLDATGGLVYSERVTAILAETLGRRPAFQFLERASAESVRTSRPLHVIIAAHLADADDHDLRARVLAAFDPAYALESSDVVIDEAVARARTVLEEGIYP